MKCWECKKKITKARVVPYYSPLQEKEVHRDVCLECLPLLVREDCHFVRVDNISQPSFKGRK